MQTIEMIEQEEDGLQAFLLTLRPRRSADPKVAYTLCGILGFFWFCASVFISYMGGWPIIGFFGGEFIFIGYMIKIFLRRTEVLETIKITPEHVTVVRRDLGVEKTKAFPAYWAQVHFSGSATSNSKLEIRSHGEGVSIGQFLSAAEKSRIADWLSDVLHRIRNSIPDANVPSENPA